MSLDAAYHKFEEAKGNTLEWFRGELAGIRTGRVKPDMMAAIQVEHYGSRNPLQGLASVSSLDARTVLISPWDPSSTAAIEKAIIAANMGAQPVVDGKNIRLAFPSLTEEIRGRTIKQLHQKAEEGKQRLRDGREEGIKILKADKQTSAITEDDFYEGREYLDKLIHDVNQEIEVLVEKKEAEIKTI